MTIGSTTNQVPYTGDGVSLAFAYSSPFITAADIKVSVAGALITTGFTVTGVADIAGSGAFTSGTVTFVTAPAAGVAIIIYCDPDQLQSTTLLPNDPLPAKSVEKMVDKVTLLIQRIRQTLSQALLFPLGETPSTLPAASLRAGNLLGFDGAGAIAIIAAAAQSASALALSMLGNAGSTLMNFLQAGTGAVLRSIQSVLRESLSVADFGGTEGGDITAALQAAVVAATGTGKCIRIPFATATISSTITLGLGGFDIDPGQCAIACTNGAGTYTFDATQTGNFTLRIGGRWTAPSNTNHFIKTKGSAAAQATIYPSIPSENQWARQLRLPGGFWTGFATVFDLQNFTREVWIGSLCYCTGNLTAIKMTGKVVNLMAPDVVLYSRVASSVAVLCRGDAGDTTYRYAEGACFTNVIADTSGNAVDLQDFYSFKWHGGQMRSQGAIGLALTQGITGFSRDWWFRDVLMNSAASIGSGLAATFLFQGTIDAVWQGIANTAVTIGAKSKGVSIKGQFDSPTGSPVGCAIGANCVGIEFAPSFIDAAYTTPLTCDTTSVAGTRAYFAMSWTPTLAFGGASVGITYGVQAGRLIWQGSTIIYQWQITLTSKGSSVGASTIGGLPFAPNVNCAGSISDYSSMSTAFTPIIGVVAGATSINIKNGAAGSPSTYLDTAYTNTSVLNGQLTALVSS